MAESVAPKKAVTIKYKLESIKDENTKELNGKR